jgi:hypothetical protein
MKDANSAEGFVSGRYRVPLTVDLFNGAASLVLHDLEDIPPKGNYADSHQNHRPRGKEEPSRVKDECLSHFHGIAPNRRSNKIKIKEVQ